MAEIKVRKAVIAGREYTLHYQIDDRDVIDGELGKSMWDGITGGIFKEQVTILLHGLKHKYKSITYPKLVKLLQEEVDAGGAWDKPVRQAFWAAIDAGLVGTIDKDKLRVVLPDPELEDEPGDEEEPASAGGKGGAGGAVPAASGI
jgi:hypothetical protein